MASALEGAADAQESGSPLDLQATLQTTQRQVKPINDIPRPIFKLTLKFWEQWALAARNQWNDLREIDKNDWPAMARTMAQHVRSGQMPNDRKIVENFIKRRPLLPWRDMKKLFGEDR